MMRALRPSRTMARYINTSATKIVATIGPASEQLPMLQHVVDAGLKIMRINFSHATYDEANLRTTNLKQCVDPLHLDKLSTDRQMCGVMLDTQGPEIRTGQFPDGGEAEVKMGDIVTVTVDDAHRQQQTKDRIWISYKDFPTSTHVGASVLIEDGIMELRVTKILSDTEVQCEVLNNGGFGNKKGVNLPGQVITLPAISNKDKSDLSWGVLNDVDYIAASFIRKAEDVREIKTFLKEEMAKHGLTGRPEPLIISKIESTEGLNNFDEILAISDGIMVARGDLGVEIPQESLLLVQKEIVRKAHEAGKPVVVATQMLDSMQKNPRPTRAECTDVSNAVFDGADCVMLSGESAKGKYPIQSVGTMKRIVDEAAKFLNGEFVSMLPGVTRLSIEGQSRRAYLPSPVGDRERIAASVSDMVGGIDATGIITVCETGKLARALSKFRPAAPIFAFVKNAKQARLLQIHYGVVPIVGAVEGLSNAQKLDSIVAQVKQLGLCKAGEKVIVVDGRPRSNDTDAGFGINVAKVL